jgi:hypothetical protein
MIPVEYKENYLVYPDGRIWIKNSNRFAKLGTYPNGYLTVKINRKNELVHRVVATCFIPNSENKSDVNHKDGIKSNNNVNNLEWNTRFDNMKHSREVLGNTHGKPKTSIRVTHIVTCKTYEFPSQTDCARILKINAKNINGCLRKKQKTYKGYTYEYLPQIKKLNNKI